MIVGICRLTLRASQSQSLKARRSVVRQIRDRVKARHHIMLAEVGGQDSWQRVVFAFAAVGGDHAIVDGVLSQVVGMVESMGLAELVSCERELLTYGDEPLAEPRWREGRGADSAAGRSAGGHEPLGAEADDPLAAAWIPDSWRTLDEENET